MSKHSPSWMRTDGSLPCSKQRLMILIHIHLRHTCDVSFTSNITVPSTSTASVLFPEGFPNKILYTFFCLYHAAYMSHPSLFAHPIFNGWNKNVNFLTHYVDLIVSFLLLLFPSHFQKLFSGSYSQIPPIDFLPVM